MVVIIAAALERELMNERSKNAERLRDLERRLQELQVRQTYPGIGAKLI